MENLWNDISTAPRNGKVVEVRAQDNDAMISGPHFMYWDGKATNLMVGDVVGLWVEISGAYTWSEKGGFGPTEWREYPKQG